MASGRSTWLWYGDRAAGPLRICSTVKELEHAARDGSAETDFFARDDAKHAKPASIKLQLYGCEYHVCMGVVHMSEAEVVKDIAAVLAKVRQGVEIVIEQDQRAIAVIKPSHPAGRMISDVIADLKARGSSATMDEDFARDIEEGINAHREPWNPPSWD